MKTTFVPVLAACMICLFMQTGYSATLPSVQQDWPKVFDVQLMQKGAHVMLQWKADAEPKEIYYEVERSTDAVNYKTAAVVLGGFSAEQNFTYLFRAKQVKDTKTYYRIKQLNNDGTYRIVSEQSF